MAQGRGGLRQGLIIGGAVFLALFLAAAFYWRADILQAALDPKKPFQTYMPPKAPDSVSYTHLTLPTNSRV